jgi:hypothetical protein
MSGIVVVLDSGEAAKRRAIMPVGDSTAGKFRAIRKRLTKS